MKKVTREEFLALTEGTIYIEERKPEVGFAIKGPTEEDGSFQKMVARADAKGKVQLTHCVETDQTQTTFHILDDIVESLTCQSLIFEKMNGWTPEEYMAKVLRLMETFVKMPDIRVRLPNGDIIAGDGKPLANVDGSATVN